MSNKHFIICNYKVSNLEPLSDLKNLEILDLSTNNISDVSPLRVLVNLEELYLYSNQITDVSSLSTLTKLKKLNVENNPTVNKVCPVAPPSVCKFGKFHDPL